MSDLRKSAEMALEALALFASDESDDGMMAVQATPHRKLIEQLMDSRVPKTEREHAAQREIEMLREAVLAEREACAKVCDNLIMYGPVAEVQQRYNKAYADCRDKIRDRGRSE